MALGSYSLSISASHLSTHLAIHPPTHLSTYPSIYPPTHPPTHPSTNPSAMCPLTDSPPLCPSRLPEWSVLLTWVALFSFCGCLLCLSQGPLGLPVGLLASWLYPP